MTVSLLLAQTEPQGGASALAQLVPLLLIVGVFYLLLIRPQQRRARQHAQLVGSVSPGDRVITVGGMHGTVQSLDDDTMRLEIAPGTVITVARSAIARRLVDADAAGGDGEAGSAGV